MGSVKYAENLADTSIAKNIGLGSGTEVNPRYLV